jgi:hypothetical protein
MVVICARIWVNFYESERASGSISTPDIAVDALVEFDTKWSGSLRRRWRGEHRGEWRAVGTVGESAEDREYE